MATITPTDISRHDILQGVRGGNYKLRTVFDAATANGFGTAVETGQLVNVDFYIHTASSASLTIKLWGSIALDEPVWTDGASATNIMTNVYMWDENDPENDNVIGATGIVLTGTDIARTLMANVNNLRWMNMEISGYVAGTVTITANGSNNQ